MEIITFTISLALVYLLKIILSSYVLLSERFRSPIAYLYPLFSPLLRFSNIFVWRLFTFLDLYQMRLSSVSLQNSPRLTKAPYADAYWFLYSTKLTYVTQRTLPR